MIQKLMFDCCAALKQTCWRISQRGSLIFDDIDCLVNWTLIWCQLLNEFMDEMIKKKLTLLRTKSCHISFPSFFLFTRSMSTQRSSIVEANPLAGHFLQQSTTFSFEFVRSARKKLFGVSWCALIVSHISSMWMCSGIDF
jgi:hypothetical protein